MGLVVSPTPFLCLSLVCILSLRGLLDAVLRPTAVIVRGLLRDRRRRHLLVRVGPGRLRRHL